MSGEGSGEGWFRQRRRVRRLHRFVDATRQRDRRLRSELRLRSLNLLARFESMVLIGAIGAVWADRVRKVDAQERRRPFIELFAATMVVLRWKHFAERFRARQ